MDIFDSGDLTWLLVCTALVLFMTPGLAIFYGSMVGSKNVVNMMSMNVYCLVVVPILWALVGFSLAFGEWDFPILGNADNFLMRGISGDEALVNFAFSATFAVIAPALMSGAVAGRMKFKAWVWFVPIWSLLVYSPVTYWVFGGNGWLINLPSHDFAGGTSIHVNAGAGALALAFVLGPRQDWAPRHTTPPHDMRMFLVGTGVLWLGWFGFNAGSALAANELASLALVNTFLAPAGAAFAWLVMGWLKRRPSELLGVCSGIVAGLVAITPAAGFVGPMYSIIIGACAGAVCYFTVHLKHLLELDDTLDVVGLHLFGGVVGGILIGFFADNTVYAGADFAEGVFFGGGGSLLLNQLLGLLSTITYSFLVTWGIAVVLDKLIGLRVSEESERVGLDRVEHAETAYSG